MKWSQYGGHKIMKRLKVLAVGDPAVDVYVSAKYNILTGFEEKNNIKVDFEILQWDEYYNRMMDALTGKASYDIIMVAGHLWLKDFVDKGYLARLTYPSDKQYDKEDILPIILDEMQLNGDYYLYPSFCDGHMILYRKSVTLAALGKLPEKVISTDDYIQMVRKCHNNDFASGVAMKAHSSEIFLDFLPYLRNEGIDAFSLETGLPTFHNEKGVLALDKYIELKKYALAGTENFGNQEVKDAFQQKKTVFTTTWGGQLGVVLDNECVDPEDVGYSTFKTPWNVTWSFAIPSSSTNKTEAEKLLIYLTSKEIDQCVGEYAGSPVRKSTYLFGEKAYPWYPIHLEMIEKFAKPLPMLKDSGAIFGCLYHQIYEAFTEKKSSKEALQTAYDDIMEVLNGGK